MDNQRLKKLAGLDKPEVVMEAPKEIVVELGNRKFKDLIDVRMAACVRGGVVSIDESGNRFDVSVTFKNDETVNERIHDFKKALGVVNDVVIEEQKVPQIDHEEYQEKLKSKTDAELKHIIKDAKEAIEANPDAPKSQGYYQDEINYAVMELNKRKKKAVKEGVDLEVVEEGENDGNKDTMYALYVKAPGDDVYSIQHTDKTAGECRQEWQDTRGDWGKGAKYKIVKIDSDNPPKTLKEGADSNFVQSVEDGDNEIATRTDTQGERSTKIEVPAAVMKSVDSRIAELKAAHEKYDDKGYNDMSSKVKAIKALEQIREYLQNYTVENAKHCVIFYNTLMSPITDLFPAVAVNFILKGRHAVGLDLNNNFKLKPVDMS